MSSHIEENTELKFYSIIEFLVNLKFFFNSFITYQPFHTDYLLLNIP